MEARALVPTYELFVILESLQQCLAEFSSALEPLSNARIDLLGCDIYYREDTDLALLALRFDERRYSATRHEWLLEFATEAGLAVLDPSMLKDSDRRRFYDSYLGEYPLRSQYNPTAEDALGALSEILGLKVPSRHQLAARANAADPNASRVPRSAATPTAQFIEEEVSVSEFRATPEPDLLSSPELDALIDVPPPPRLPTRPITGRPREARAGGVPTPVDDEPTNPVQSPMDIVAIENQIGTPAPLPEPPRVAVSDLLPRGKQGSLNPDHAAADDPPTRPGRPSSMQTTPPPGEGLKPPKRSPRSSSTARRLGSKPRDTVRAPAPPPSVARPARGTQPPALKLRATSPNSAPRIAVRIRRGDDWMQARLRSLSLKGAYLACGAPPRLHDDVHIALGLENAGTVVRGTVVHVTDADDGEKSGACGFGVVFPTIDSPSRRQLKELLQQARARGVVLDPPPPRGSVRFPVRWPIRFILPDKRGVDLSALDVSDSGLFVATHERLPAGNLDFYMPTEQGGAPIQGRARVVREVPWKMAAAQGLSSGFGMQITSLKEGPINLFANFVERVRRRTRRKVLVGASAERADELVAGLASAGYEVTGTSDVNALLQHAECDPRPPDATIIDSSMGLSTEISDKLYSLMSAKAVPLVNIGGEAPERARAVIDNLLQVH